jgi:LDH2 family malate/lactate/ureidoglycolate dehydrogenase
MALDAQMASMVCVNTDIRLFHLEEARPFWGQTVRVRFSCRKDAILLDMATSEIAWGKVLTARKRRDLEGRWAVDEKGRLQRIHSKR